MSDNYHHRHNRVDAGNSDAARDWGIRVSLPARDPFTRLVGNDWTREHWYDSESARDTALKKMATRHGYYRVGDDVSLIFEKVERGK